MNAGNGPALLPDGVGGALAVAPLTGVQMRRIQAHHPAPNPGGFPRLKQPLKVPRAER